MSKKRSKFNLNSYYVSASVLFNRSSNVKVTECGRGNLWNNVTKTAWKTHLQYQKYIILKSLGSYYFRSAYSRVVIDEMWVREWADETVTAVSSTGSRKPQFDLSARSHNRAFKM